MSNKVETIGHNVVSLESKNDRRARVRLARLPQAVEAVRSAFQRDMTQRLKTYFERADDSLFDLADKASSNEEQNMFFDSMREVRIRRHSIELNFSKTIDEAFAALDDAAPNMTPDDAYDTVKADALSLVLDDDLEALVAVDSSVAKANAEYGEAIQFISLRLDSLVPVKVYQKNNPVGADVVSSAFMAEIKKLDVSIKAKLLLFRLFDKIVINNLGDTYRQLNDTLVEHNVMPSLPGASARHTGQERERRTSRGQARAPSNKRPAAPALEISHEVASTLSELLGNQIVAEGGIHLNADELAATQLVQVLNAAQHAEIQSPDIQRSADIREIVASLRARHSKTQLSTTEDQVMNLVNMLFDFILEDRNLPEPMKVLISRMQIPVIKVALADKTFFTTKGHVARKLLNEMSTAAIGWQGDTENSGRDPLYRKIDQIVRTLISDFDTDTSIFNDLLADFTAFLEKERRRTAVLERRTVDAEDGKAKAEVARKMVAKEIDARTSNIALPDAVNKLVHDAWNNVLFVTALKHGHGSAEWKGMLTALDELLWSVQVPENAAARKRLIKTVPALLKKLRSGLDTISYNPFEMSTLFKALEEVHLSCIRGKPSVVAKPEVAEAKEAPRKSRPPAAAKVPEVSVHNTAGEGDIQEPVEDIAAEGLNSLGRSSDLGREVIAAEHDEAQPQVDEVYLKQVRSFVQGAWFDMKSEDERDTRCRLAAFIKPTGKYIFVNRNGMKVAEKTALDLAWMLKEEALRPLDNSMLFDRALETIVSGMRNKGRG